MTANRSEADWALAFGSRESSGANGAVPAAASTVRRFMGRKGSCFLGACFNPLLSCRRGKQRRRQPSSPLASGRSRFVRQPRRRPAVWLILVPRGGVTGFRLLICRETTLLFDRRPAGRQ